MASGGEGVSVEIRRVTVGECDCGIPKYSWQRCDSHEHYWECDYGRVPSFDINNPAPLVIVGRDFAHRLIATGPELHRLVHHAIDVVPATEPDGEVTENSVIRMFYRIEYHGRSWTWELKPAYWADRPTRFNNAHTPIYLGRWPD